MGGGKGVEVWKEMLSWSETLGDKKVEADLWWKAKEGERSEERFRPGNSGDQILWEMEKLWVAGA